MTDSLHNDAMGHTTVRVVELHMYLHEDHADSTTWASVAEDKSAALRFRCPK